MLDGRYLLTLFPFIVLTFSFYNQCQRVRVIGFRQLATKVVLYSVLYWICVDNSPFLIEERAVHGYLKCSLHFYHLCTWSIFLNVINHVQDSLQGFLMVLQSTNENNTVAEDTELLLCYKFTTTYSI